MGIRYIENIDNFLGARNSRYFGDGYLLTNQRVFDFSLSERGGFYEISCLGQVEVPELWSMKNGVKQTPHLSTIDIIELSSRVVCLFLRNEWSKDDLPYKLIKNMAISAGNSPVEGDLSNIEILGISKLDDVGDTLIELSIANMSVSVVLAGTPLIYHKNIAMEGRSMSIDISDVYVNTEKLSSFGVVNPLEPRSESLWSLSSCFSATLQAGQTLLYLLDDVDRNTSNTLWMKKTFIKFHSHIPSFDFAQPLYTKLENVRKYQKNDGFWRRADISSSFCNMNIICSVTHKLPLQN